MTTPFFLIDFENVQPKALDRLQPGAARIKVFLGQHQSRLMLDLVQALQSFGKDAEYIQIHGSGPDAVDFHIAFYIGRLAPAHPGASFTIVSKDRGFDPLVKHLGTLGIKCQRLPDIPEPAKGKAASPASGKTATPAVTKKAAKPSPTPAIKAAPVAKAVQAPVAATARARAAQVVAWLQKMSKNKPAKLATLRSSIRARFTPQLDDKQVDAVLQSLQGSKKIVIEGTKVTYAL